MIGEKNIKTWKEVIFVGEVELLTVNDLAKRWRSSESAIRNYIRDGVLTPCKGVPGLKFHPKYIAELEGVEIERFSPLEKRRLERENEELKNKYESVKRILSTILAESSKVINL